MDKKQVYIQEKEQIINNLLTNSAIADIAINDLGLTLDNPMFFSPYSSFVEYGIDSEYGNYIRFEALLHMAWHLCTLNNGIDLAKKLAKKSGLINCKIFSDTITEDYIESSMKQCIYLIRCGIVSDFEFESAFHYEKTFKYYCLNRIDKNQLEERIKTKINSFYNPETYRGFFVQQKTIL